MSPAAVTAAAAEKSALPPAQQLILELLAAQWRLGEAAWVFPGKARQSLEALQGKNLLWWQQGSVPGTCMASLTEAGRQVALAGSYEDPSLPVPPMVAEMRSRTDDLYRMLADLEYYIDRQARRITASVHADAGRQIGATRAATDAQLSAAGAQLSAVAAQLSAADARIAAMQEEAGARDVLIAELRQRLDTSGQQLTAARTEIRQRDDEILAGGLEDSLQESLRDQGDSFGGGQATSPRPDNETGREHPPERHRGIRSRKMAANGSR
jgi:hypothetical protein